MLVNFIDRYASSLSSSYASGGTSLDVASAAGLPSGAGYFFAIVKAEGTNTEEVFKVTNVSGTTLTVVGAQAGTSASNHGAGAVIVGSIMTAAALAGMVEWSENETPSGTIDGSNTSFTLANSPSPTASLRLYKNGVLQIQGTDYTLSGTSISFTTAPDSSDTLTAFYRY